MQVPLNPVQTLERSYPPASGSSFWISFTSACTFPFVHYQQLQGFAFRVCILSIDLMLQFIHLSETTHQPVLPCFIIRHLLWHPVAMQKSGMCNQPVVSFLTAPTSTYLSWASVSWGRLVSVGVIDSGEYSSYPFHSHSTANLAIAGALSDCATCLSACM